MRYLAFAEYDFVEEAPSIKEAIDLCQQLRGVEQPYVLEVDDTKVVKVSWCVAPTGAIATDDMFVGEHIDDLDGGES